MPTLLLLVLLLHQLPLLLCWKGEVVGMLANPQEWFLGAMLVVVVLVVVVVVVVVLVVVVLVVVLVVVVVVVVVVVEMRDCPLLGCCISSGDMVGCRDGIKSTDTDGCCGRTSSGGAVSACDCDGSSSLGHGGGGGGRTPGPGLWFFETGGKPIGIGGIGGSGTG